ncbi:hypothetical protein DPEC_G00026320 [Dallia pectoralis]|uniref:Uncharacterized protein n=1 Tax=Dallia pectoralis TaxID=75939 RepID=A0ACC2HI13_DALPE|nr:hypothetical protein DPEC_G00026320 [Dallia pectoralis]
MSRTLFWDRFLGELFRCTLMSQKLLIQYILQDHCRCAQLYPKYQGDHLTRDMCSPLGPGISLPVRQSYVVVKRSPRGSRGLDTASGKSCQRRFASTAADLWLLIVRALMPAATD